MGGEAAGLLSLVTWLWSLRQSLVRSGLGQRLWKSQMTKLRRTSDGHSHLTETKSDTNPTADLEYTQINGDMQYL